MKDLLRIALLLDESGKFHLSDKLFKIAQANQEQDPGALVRKIVSDGDGYKSLSPEEFEQYKKNYSLLNTTSVDEFTQKLFEFGRSNNMNNLTKAFDSYANAGAKFNGQSIKSNPVLNNLYNWVKNTNEMITPQMLSGALNYFFSGDQNHSSQEIIYNKDRNELTLGTMPGLMKEPNNPSSYSDYGTYLRETGQKRKAPIGANNDVDIRDPNYLQNQQQNYNQWLEDIKVYANSNNVDQLDGLKGSVRDDVNLTPASRNKLYGIINYYKSLISK
jgi:hypothetical protein